MAYNETNERIIMDRDKLTDELVAMAILYVRLNDVVDTHDTTRYANDDTYRDGVDSCTEMCDKIYDDMISCCRVIKPINK